MHALVGQVNFLRVAVKKAYAFEHLANGIDDVRHVEIAGRHYFLSVQKQRQRLVEGKLNSLQQGTLSPWRFCSG
jgi:hypothetical protein